MGINRGPSAAFAILLTQGWTIWDALDLVHEARPFACIAYAEDALRWHHDRAGVPRQLRREDHEALRAWRAAHEEAITDALRALYAQEAARLDGLDRVGGMRSSSRSISAHPLR
jgi:hypothetical protein